MIKNKIKFITSIKEELFKIVYPKKNETIKAFFIVIGLAFILGVGIWLLDGVLFNVYQYALNLK